MKVSDLLDLEKMKEVDKQFNRLDIKKKITRKDHLKYQEQLETNAVELNRMQSDNEPKGMQAMKREEDYE